MADTRTASGILLPPMAQRDVQRGREAAEKIRDLVDEYKARGDRVLEVRVSRDVANFMRAFFAVAFREFDGVLPPTVSGVPFAEGDTGGRDYQITTERRGKRDH